MKRFKIIENDFNQRVAQFETTKECFDWLTKNGQESLRGYNIVCVVDDIEIDDIEFMQSFHEGECPMDLQFF